MFTPWSWIPCPQYWEGWGPSFCLAPAAVHQSWEMCSAQCAQCTRKGPHVISSLLRTSSSSSSQNIIPLSTLSPTCGIIILLCIVLFVVLSRHFRSVSLLPSDSLPDISLPLQSVCKSSEHLWAKLLKLLLNVYCHCCFHWHCLVCVSKICVTNFEPVTMCSMELLWTANEGRQH